MKLRATVSIPYCQMHFRWCIFHQSVSQLEMYIKASPSLPIWSECVHVSTGERVPLLGLVLLGQSVFATSSDNEGVLVRHYRLTVLSIQLSFLENIYVHYFLFSQRLLNASHQFIKFVNYMKNNKKKLCIH